MFNLYIHHLARQVLHCDLFRYVDDSSLVKVIKRKEDGITAAEEITADLNCVFPGVGCGKLILNLLKLKHDVECHLPLFMDSLSIEEVDNMKILGFYFDCRLRWSCIIIYMIKHTSTELPAENVGREWEHYTMLEIIWVQKALLLLLHPL